MLVASLEDMLSRSATKTGLLAARACNGNANSKKTSVANITKKRIVVEVRVFIINKNHPPSRSCIGGGRKHLTTNKKSVKGLKADLTIFQLMLATIY